MAAKLRGRRSCLADRPSRRPQSATTGAMTATMGVLFKNRLKPATGRVTQTLTIPRGVSVIAEGRAEANGEGWVLEVETTEDGRVGAIAQTPFLAQKARTLAFTHRIEVEGDTLRYTETTLVDIYGRRFEHTDRNTLQRTA